jgi:hypothetical protein
MTVLVASAFAVGDEVVVNKEGAEFGLSGDMETTILDREGNAVTAVGKFFEEGLVGRVVFERISGVDRPQLGDIHEFAVMFAVDPMKGRAWWMCVDEVAKKEVE